MSSTSRDRPRPRSKGETLLDTVYTLQAMHTDLFVIRTAESGAPAAWSRARRRRDVAVASGGESHLSHPTQGLLDTLTILQHKPDLDRLDRVHRGDIAHSRVARSAAHALCTLGVRELRLVSPPGLKPAAHASSRRTTWIPTSIACLEDTLMSSWRCASRRSACRRRRSRARAPIAKHYGINRTRAIRN